jgi:hypothetical protein
MTTNTETERNGAPREQRTEPPQIVNAQTFNRPNDQSQQQVIFEPIHTASVSGEAKPFVIYGINVLDQLEASGHQIVDENGNWVGILAEPGRVIHHQCTSHEEVWGIVASLNRKRRQNGGAPCR